MADAAQHEKAVGREVPGILVATLVLLLGMSFNVEAWLAIPAAVLFLLLGKRR